MKPAIVLSHAWHYAVDWLMVFRDDGDIDIVAIGADTDGRLVEMTAREKQDCWAIFHANTPISHRTRREFGL